MKLCCYETILDRGQIRPHHVCVKFSQTLNSYLANHERVQEWKMNVQIQLSPKDLIKMKDLILH